MVFHVFMCKKGEVDMEIEQYHTVQPTCIISFKCRKIRSKLYIYKRDATTQGYIFKNFLVELFVCLNEL